MNKEIIVIVGFGWVGQANALALTQMGYEVFYFDPGTPDHKYADKYADLYSKVGRLSSVLEKDGPDTWYIVSVGDRVSPEGDQDISLIQKALDSLKNARGGVVLRSTILPQKLAGLSFDYYVPEFLHEKKAVEECILPAYFIVGSRSGVKAQPSFFEMWRRSAPKVFFGTPEEASYVKYLSNVWNSLRIAFVNEFGNAIATPSDQKNLADIEKVVNFFFERKSYMQYGRAYGGHCLPKDTRAFVKAHADQGRNMALLEGMWRSNDRQVELEKKYPHLPEWFSEWVRPEISGWFALRSLKSAVRRKLFGGKSKKKA